MSACIRRREQELHRLRLQGFVQKWVNTFKVSTHQRDLHRRVMRSLIGEPLEENFSPPQCDNKHPAKRLLNSWRYFRCDDFKNRNSLSIYLVYYKREGKQKYNIIYKQISSDDVSKIATTENPRIKIIIGEFTLCRNISPSRERNQNRRRQKKYQRERDRRSVREFSRRTSGWLFSLHKHMNHTHTISVAGLMMFYNTMITS